MRPSYVIFDLDHTLIRSSGMTAAFWAAADEVGFDPERAARCWKESRGRSLYEQALEISDDPDLVEPFVALFWEHFGAGDPTPLEGAAETLTALGDAGLKLYLSTGSHPRVMRPWLERLGWLDHFALALGTETNHQKGPAHYATIVEHAGGGLDHFAANAATVGDGQYDMRFGAEHGIRMRVGYAPASSPRGRATELLEAGATHLIADLRALPRLLHADTERAAGWASASSR